MVLRASSPVVRGTPSRSLPPLDPLQRYSIEEACKYLRLSRAGLYQRLADGRLKCIHDGRRAYVPGSEIARVSR